jgi:hypothetical protein
VGNGRSLQRINAAEKRRKVVDARAEGHPWRKVAEIAGYATAESAIRAFDQAMREGPVRNAEDWRAEQIEQLQVQYSKLGAIIASPPPVHSAIGKVVINPETGEIVRDMALVTRAIAEQRKVGESLRRLLGVDATPRSSPTPEDERQLADAMGYVHQLAERVKALESENSVLRLQLAQWENGTLQHAIAA